VSSTRFRALAAALVGGAAFALAAPPTDFYPGVWLGLGALYVALASAPHARAAFFRGWVWATAAGLIGMAFIPGVVARFTPLGMTGGIAALVLLSAFQALAWAFGAVCGFWLSRRFGVASELAFGVSVLIAISLPTVIAWTPASLISPWPALVQLADLIGERGVSVIFALVAALVATAFLRWFEVASVERAYGSWPKPLAGALITGLLLGYGVLRMRQLHSTHALLPSVRLGVVQAAVPAELRWEAGARELIIARLRELTRHAESQGVELTLWPEAAYPYVLPHSAASAPSDGRAIVGSGVHGPVLFGLITQAVEQGGRYNAATLVEPNGALHAPQAKMALLWFGETIPLSEYLPALRQIFFRAGSLLPGPGVVLIERGETRIGVLNCYEDTLPAIGRRVARARPNLLVNLTNDAWFGRTSEPELHLRLAVLRAVEARLDLVRAVNLGVPAWIDATGSIRARGADDRASVLVVTPALNDTSPTLYTRAGDIPVWLVLVLATALGAARRSRRQTARQSTNGHTKPRTLDDPQVVEAESSLTERDLSEP